MIPLLVGLRNSAYVAQVKGMYLLQYLDLTLGLLQIPQIIVHNTGPDGSLRGAAASMGIHAVTIEIGNPQRFHQAFIERTYKGVLSVLSYLKVCVCVCVYSKDHYSN